MPNETTAVRRASNDLHETNPWSFSHRAGKSPNLSHKIPQSLNGPLHLASRFPVHFWYTTAKAPILWKTLDTPASYLDASCLRWRVERALTPSRTCARCCRYSDIDAACRRWSEPCSIQLFTLSWCTKASFTSIFVMGDSIPSRMVDGAIWICWKIRPFTSCVAIGSRTSHYARAFFRITLFRILFNHSCAFEESRGTEAERNALFFKENLVFSLSKCCPRSQ